MPPIDSPRSPALDDARFAAPAAPVEPATPVAPAVAPAEARTTRGTASIRDMFDDIAPVYDRLNTLMTLGSDAGWRRAAVAATGIGRGQAVIDVACGTGKLTAGLAERVGPFGRVYGVDLSPRMIERAISLHGDLIQVGFAIGDALDLPVEDATYDAATIAFGMRNLPDFEGGFRELRRVVRPGGRIVCLELTHPQPRWWGRIHRAVFRRLAPAAGTLVARRSAFRYLPTSLDGFPDADRLATIMRDSGLLDVRYRRLGLGGVAIHVGVVPRS